MRKVKLFALLFFLAGIIFFACKKNNEQETASASEKEKATVSSIPRCPPDQTPVNFYSALFTEDPTFEVVVDNFGNSAYDVVEMVYKTGGKELVAQYDKLVHGTEGWAPVQEFYEQNGIDADAMLTKKAEVLASLLLLYKNHPDFYNMSIEDQSTVIRNVFTSLSEPQFRALHPKSPVVITYTALAERLGAEITPAQFRLTMSEVGDCLRDAVIGVIASSSSIIRDLYNTITGYNLGWSGIIRVAKSALSTVLHGNLIGAAVGFGLCIAWETFF